MKKPGPGAGEIRYIKKNPKDMVAEKIAARKVETGLTKQSPSSPSSSRSVKGGVEAPSGYGKQNRDSYGVPKQQNRDSSGVPRQSNRDSSGKPRNVMPMPRRIPKMAPKDAMQPMPRKIQKMDPKKAIMPAKRY